MQGRPAETNYRMDNAKHRSSETDGKEPLPDGVPHRERTEPCEQADREHTIAYGQMTVNIDGQEVTVRTMKNSDLQLVDW